MPWRMVGVVALEVAEAARSRAAALQSLQVAVREKVSKGVEGGSTKGVERGRDDTM